MTTDHVTLLGPCETCGHSGEHRPAREAAGDPVPAFCVECMDADEPWPTYAHVDARTLTERTDLEHEPEVAG